MENLNIMLVSGPQRESEPLQRLLLQAGIRNIRCCGHIREAEQELLREPVDLLICDIQMPDEAAPSWLRRCMPACAAANWRMRRCCCGTAGPARLCRSPM